MIPGDYQNSDAYLAKNWCYLSSGFNFPSSLFKLPARTPDTLVRMVVLFCSAFQRKAWFALTPGSVSLCWVQVKDDEWEGIL